MEFLEYLILEYAPDYYSDFLYESLISEFQTEVYHKYKRHIFGNFFIFVQRYNVLQFTLYYKSTRVFAKAGSEISDLIYQKFPEYLL